MIVPFTELPDDAGGYPRPVLDVTVAEAQDILIPCLVDSGALNTLLPRWAAEVAGVEIGRFEPRRLAVGARTTEASFATVRLAGAAFEWEAEVGFCEPWPYSWGLLGQLSFFRYFTVTLRAADHELELTPISG